MGYFDSPMSRFASAVDINPRSRRRRSFALFRRPLAQLALLELGNVKVDPVLDSFHLFSLRT